MASTYNTPGVYIEEIVKLPPSVASVQTSIPCFFGKTEKAFANSKDDLKGVSTKINSLAEYESLYGYSDRVKASVLIKLNVPSVATVENYFNNMYFSVKHYFDNGGGPCYIHCVGYYITESTTAEKTTAETYKDALSKLDLVDEVTLVVLPDLAGLEDPVKAYDVYNKAMQKAASLKDKFVIIDVYEELNGLKVDSLKSKSAFRNNISNNIDDIKYGAAYYPSLQTNYTYNISNAAIKMTFADEVIAASPSSKLLNKFDYQIAKNIFTIYTTLLIFDENYFTGIKKDEYGKKKDEIRNRIESLFAILEEVEKEKLNLSIIALGARIEELGIAANTATFDYEDSPKKEKETLLGHLETKLIALYTSAKITVPTVEASTYAKLETTFLKNIAPFFNSAFDAKLRETFLNIAVVLPASPAIAGIYATVDRNRGVWKAPANVSLASVVKPHVLLSDLDQEDFNIDPENGKSINCIRQFVGRGNLVWGGRTLAGNNNEWKYINVRRFFNMVEESCENAARNFVFEPNDANTWVRVKGMLQNYLTNLWRQGALQGAKPEQAFYVSVGLNQTMTQDDILNGVMIVEIGLAVVRPAEFIILRFSHKLALS